MCTSYINAPVSQTGEDNLTDSVYIAMQLGNGYVSIIQVSRYSMSANTHQR